MKKKLLFTSILILLSLSFVTLSNQNAKAAVQDNRYWIVSSNKQIIKPSSISLDKTSDTLAVGKTDRLIAKVLPSNTSNKKIKWTSSNSSIVRVANGVITGVSKGEATITATTEDGGKTAVCNVDVIVPPASVTLNRRTDNLSVGESDTLKPTVLPQNATVTDLVWTSSNPSVATVDNGVVKAVSRGTSTIKVITKPGNKIASCVVTVIAHPSSISLNKTLDFLAVGKTDRLTATISPANSNNKNIKWTSSDSSVVKVVNGVITGVSKGEAIITATTEDGGKTATCTVKVIIPVTSIRLDKNSEVLVVGKTGTLVPTVLPESASIKDVTWTSSNSGIASVENGVVKGISSGTATVKATTLEGNKVATCTITVINSPVTSGTIVFKDKNLDKAIRNKINKPTGDIYKSDVENITKLDIENASIKDISGIENLTSLEYLCLDGNQISDISVLKWLTNLETLKLNKNQINDISALKELTKLQKVYLNNNKITDVSALKELVNLQELYLDNNKITDINALKELVKLQELHLNNNKISNISALKDLVNVQKLELSKNQINDISELRGLTSLLKLRLGSNKIEDISVLRGLINLKYIDLSSNRIDDIGSLVGLTNLSSINLRSTQVKSADIELLKDYLPDCHNILY